MGKPKRIFSAQRTFLGKQLIIFAPMTYSELILRLFNINKTEGMKFGLDNMKHLSDALGNPEKKFASIHIAGTNGKGSVTTKIASALAHKGYQVGLYTSPHISCFRERIRVNGQMIPEEKVVQILQRIFKIINERSIPATFFEITTMLAFLYFAECGVQYGVIETGMGGRLDATNIIVPELSIITSISFDHTETLGHSVHKIAKEKAGIIKIGVPVLIGPRVPLKTIQKEAGPLKADLIQVEGKFTDFNQENNAIAKAALEYLEVDADAISKGLEALPPCRIETIVPAPKQSFLCPEAIIMDVGHNPDGLRQLFKAVRKKYPRRSIRAVCGLSKNKDIDGCLKVLKTYVDDFHLVQSTNGRGQSTLELQKALIKLGVPVDRIKSNESIQASVMQAVHKAHEAKQIIVICGTFFIMSEARKALGIVEPRDPIDMNESFPLASISP